MSLSDPLGLLILELYRVHLETPADITGRCEYRLSFLHERIKTMTIDDLGPNAGLRYRAVASEVIRGEKGEEEGVEHATEMPPPFLLRLRHLLYTTRN